MEVEGRRSYLPREWADEERMRVMMGPMPVGPHEQVARASRHTFWAAAIHSWCRAARQPCFTLHDCQGAFRVGTQTPQCLPEVLQHMIRQGEVVPLSQLSLGEPQSESWLGWGRRVLVTRPTQLAWGQLKRAVGMDDLQRTVLVCVAELQEMCNKVVERIWFGKGFLLTTEGELYREVGEEVGSAGNLHLVVEVLAGDGRAATTTHNGTTYVKFMQLGDTGRPAITQEELAESDLKRAKERVEASLTSLREEQDALRTQAKSALRSGSRAEALSLLRRRKRVDKSLETQLGVLENLSSWLHQLQDMDTNRQVLGALRGGVEALRTALAGEASPDAAAATLDDLQQVLEECDDLNSLVARNPLPEEETDSLEKELAELLLYDAEQEEGTEPQLPDVPTIPPLQTLSHPRLSS